MKINLKYIVIPIFLLCTIPMMGQRDTIIVGFGETFETIAAKFGVSLNNLYAANPGKEKCYAGMKVIVPAPDESPVGDSDITSPVLLRADSLLIEAKALNMSNRYKKAIKIYNKVLDMGVRTPYALSGRGESYFGLKKYKKARTDLKEAIYSGQLAEVEKEWCEEALEDVEKELQAKRERRNQILANVGLTVGAATALTVSAWAQNEQAKMQQKQFQQSPNLQYNAPSGSGLGRANQIIAQSDAYLNNVWRPQANAQLNNMTYGMMAQAQQTKQRMNKAFSDYIQWTGEFYKKNGRQPTEYEGDQWYSAHYPDLLHSRIMGRGMMAEKMQKSETNQQTNDYKSESSVDYQASYKRYERIVESWFNNLTTGGYKYEDKNNDIKGKTRSDMPSYAYVGNQMGMKNAQREMRRIRLEAAKNGVHIVESKWETATSGF